MRIVVPNLKPASNYYLELQGVSGTEVSPWSRKFSIATNAYSTAPNTPTGITWATAGDSFQAEWNAVTTNVAGKTVPIVRYEMELVASGMTKFVSVIPQTSSGSKVSYNLSFAANAALFGTAQGSITMRVRAVDNLDVKSAWSAPLLAEYLIPDPPTNAIVEELNEAIKLSWTAPANMLNVTGYRVYVGATAGFTPNPSNRIYQGEGTTTTYVTGTFSLHYFKIRSYSKYGTESTDLTAQGTPVNPYLVDTTAPSVPTGLAVTTDRTGSIAKANLTWSFNATLPDNEDIQAFVIKWYKAGEASKYSLEYTDKTSRTLSIPLPEAYSDYIFQIAAVDFVANYSAYSPTVTLSNSVPGPPVAVTGLTASTGMDNIQLSWTASASGDVIHGGFYKVTVATDAGFTTGVLNYQTGNTNISVSGLTSGVTYYYRVIATDSTAQDSSAVTGSATTDAFPIPDPSDGSPPASSPTPTVTPGIGYLFLSWLPVTNNDPVTYEIHVSVTSGFTPNPGTKAGEIQGTVANLRNTAGGTPLAYGTTYYVKIIAKDVDGAAAASAQGSGTPAKLTNSDSSLVITAADVQTGTLGASIITLGTGGIIQSSNWTGAADSPGFQITQNSIIMRSGTISAGVLESGSSITANLNVTGNMTISSSGTIKSTNYVANTSGFSLSATGLDIRTGTIAVGTLIGGTISSQTITLGAGGAMIVDSTAVIRSNNWNGSSTGWQLSSTGLTVYGLNATLAASNIIGDTVSGRNLTVSSGGSISSSNWNGSSTGWQIAGTGFTMFNGTISGTSITTNALTSLSNDPVTGLALFSINNGGYATFSGARIYGNTILGSATSNFIQSNTFNLGSNGWKMDGAGNAWFNSATITGTVTGSSFDTAASGERIVMSSASGQKAWIHFYTGVSGEYLPSGITASTSGIPGLWTNSTGGGATQNIQLAPPGYSSYTGNIPKVAMSTTSAGAASMLLKVPTGDIVVESTGMGIYANTGVSGTFYASGVVTFANLGASGTPAYVMAGVGGVLTRGAVPSSLKVKENIREIEVSAKDVVSLKPYKYNYIESPGVDSVGFIAEHAHELGLSDWVGYDDKNEPMGFNYPFFVVAQQIVLREHEKQVQDFKSEIKDLKKQIKAILSRLDS